MPKRCPKHRTGKYSPRFDTYYCAQCDRWLGSKCATPRFCVLCTERPRRPSMGC